MSDVSRRKFIALAGSTAAGVWLTANRHEILAAGRHAAQATRFETLSAADAADIEAAAAQIIPTDATPGAKEARVIYFIDKALVDVRQGSTTTMESAAKELRARAAKTQRGAKSFAALSSRAADRRAHGHGEGEARSCSGVIRYGTIAGMLANPEWGGNYQKTGWRWIGFDDRFSWAAPFGWYDRDG